MEKKDYLAVGAFLTGLADLGLEALYMSDPAKWGGAFPYNLKIPVELPPGDDWIVGAGLPLFFYGLGHATKSQNLKDVGKGGGIYGACMLGHHTVGRITYSKKGWPPAAKVGQFNIDYDFPTTNIIRRPRRAPGQFNIDWTPPAVTNVIRSEARSAALLPGPPTHSGEFLPFQQDLGY